MMAGSKVKKKHIPGTTRYFFLSFPTRVFNDQYCLQTAMKRCGSWRTYDSTAYPSDSDNNNLGDELEL